MHTHVPGRWLALARCSDRLDPRPMLERLGGPDGLERASPAAMLRAGWPPSVVDRMLTTPDLGCELAWTRLGDPDYPQALLDLPRPPPVLWARGDRGVLERSGVAVVGARACTGYGRRVASRLGGAVAAGGGLLVSGAARGIDAAAHEGCLDGGGATVAVLGAGLLAPASGWAQALHQRIVAEGGLLLSELPPEDDATRWTFPRRNRIIAALARSTVVVEAGARSGARHTADAARQLGRELWVVPGPLGAPASVGTLALLEEGARCLTAISEVTRGLSEASALDALPRRLRGALSAPRSLEEVCVLCDLELRDAVRLLAGLEVQGVVRRRSDQRYELAG